MALAWNTFVTGLKQRMKWLTGRNVTVPGTDCCAIGILPDQFYLGISRGAGAAKSDLLLSYPYEKGRMADTLERVALNHQLAQMDCRWILYPEQYALFLMDDLPVPASEFQAAIRWKLTDALPFPAQESVIDHFHIPPHKTHDPQSMIMVAAAQFTILENGVDAINRAGLHLTEIGIQELALTQLVSQFDTGEKGLALVYLEEKSGELLIMRQRSLYLQRSFVDGWGAMREVFSSPVVGNEGGICSQIEDLALEIQRSLDFYQVQWRQQAPAQIFLATSLPAADSRRIADALVSCFSIPVILVPLEKSFPAVSQRWMSRQGRFLPVLGGLLSREAG